jgi:hypothetical protein
MTRALFLLFLTFVATGSNAEVYYSCTVETVCTEDRPCNLGDIPWTFELRPAFETWRMIDEPDDGEERYFTPIGGMGETNGALFLFSSSNFGDEEQVTLLTIRPDKKFALTWHSTAEFDLAETAFGTCDEISE